jgi:amino-acid N-acetyltransferase
MNELKPSTNNAVLRDAIPADLGAARELISRLELPVDGLEDFFSESYIVATEEERLVGVAGIEIYGQYGLLRSVAVEPEFQGNSLGAGMIFERLERARESGLRAVYLITTTAEEYFPRFGFQLVERSTVPAEIQYSKEYSESCPESATVMVLHFRD